MSTDSAFQEHRTSQIAIALQLHQKYEGTLPSACYWTEPGRAPEPSLALSWRFRLLPFVEGDEIYRSWKKDEPWNSPNNFPLAEQRNVYSDDYWSSDPFTRYRVFHGNGALFELHRQVKPAEITDGAANTILFVQAGETVPWPQCNELQFDPAGPLPPLGRPDRDSFLVAMADGSVKVVRKDADPKVIRAAITRAGGETPVDW